MLNGWDFLTIIFVGFLILEIIKQICTTATVNNAVKKAETMNSNKDDVLDKANKLIDAAIRNTERVINERIQKVEKKVDTVEKKFISIVDAENHDLGLTIEAASKKGTEKHKELEKKSKTKRLKKTILTDDLSEDYEKLAGYKAIKDKEKK